MKCWTDGLDNYRINTLDRDKFTCELIDVDYDNTQNINQIFYDILKGKNVELLFSGGMDSEAVMRSCLFNKINVTAVTMRMLVDNCPINTHDLYYSEKFCRENNVKHRIVDLDVRKLFESGKYLDYLVPYRIDEPHVATHFWLLEQCTSFPVIGGGYTWPWYTEKIVSPHRLRYSCYDLFLSENSMNGVGNMLGHSLAANILFIKKHLNVFQRFTYDSSINAQKKHIYEELGLGPLELRFSSYGWDSIGINSFNKMQYKIELLKRVGSIKSIIKWNNSIGDVIGSGPGTNDKFN